jgi:hypothetical protein
MRRSLLISARRRYLWSGDAMELVAIENSRIIYLTQVHRPAGELYYPDAAEKLVERYSFVKYPSIEEITRQHPLVFGIGKYGVIQINELTIYQDGIIVSSRSDTDRLDEFISDLFEWSEKELGLIKMPASRPEKYYESAIIIKSDIDLAQVIAPKDDVAKIANDFFLEVVPNKQVYTLSGFALDCDPFAFPSKRKPLRFYVERRLGIPYSENIFFSQAPLPTKVHLAFLRALEDLRGQK